MRSVSVWDRTQPGCPTIAEDHPRLTPLVAAQVLAYLNAGTVVVRSTAMTADWFAPGAGPRVRASTYTDGAWFWGDALVYYVQNYALSPGQEFLEYVEARNFEPRVPSDAEVGELLSLLGVR